MTGMCEEIGPQACLLPLTIYVAAPRGFCAGVDRAIQIVELALAKYGAPVYVRHEIVHNRHVVETLKAKGAILVEELDEIPDTQAPVIFSAHGVPKSVPEAAQASPGPGEGDQVRQRGSVRRIQGIELQQQLAGLVQILQRLDLGRKKSVFGPATITTDASSGTDPACASTSFSTM